LRNAWRRSLLWRGCSRLSAVGRYEDELAKRDGMWLITKRRRIE
jgi:hypothetical protein